MKKILLSSIIILSMAMGFVACKKELQPTTIGSFNYELPANAPRYDINASEQQNWLTHTGRMLFYDKQLSAANTVACASCHKQEFGFADNSKFSTGVRGIQTPRNSPAIVRSFGGLFWDARANSLEDLSTQPVMNHLEMGIEDFSEVLNKVSHTKVYEKAFGNAGINTINEESIQKALAAFMRTMSQDNVQKIWNNIKHLTGKEQRGKEIFDKNCGACHSGQHFDSDWGFGRIGARKNIGLDYTYADKGIGDLTKEPSQDGFFRVPSLLNIRYTAPYMHDGRFNTLEEVVEHYNSGIKNHKNLSWELKSGNAALRMNMSDYEKEALVSFLKSIKNPEIKSHQNYSNPFSS